MISLKKIRRRMGENNDNQKTAIVFEGGGSCSIHMPSYIEAANDRTMPGLYCHTLLLTSVV